MTQTRLAQMLGVSETVVRRMLNPKHDTKPGKMQAARAAARTVAASGPWAINCEPFRATH